MQSASRSANHCRSTSKEHHADVAHAARPRRLPGATPPPRLRPATSNKRGQPPNPWFRVLPGSFWARSSAAEETPQRSAGGVHACRGGSRSVTKRLSRACRRPRTGKFSCSPPSGGACAAAPAARAPWRRGAQGATARRINALDDFCTPFALRRPARKRRIITGKFRISRTAVTFSGRETDSINC